MTNQTANAQATTYRPRWTSYLTDEGAFAFLERYAVAFAEYEKALEDAPYEDCEGAPAELPEEAAYRALHRTAMDLGLNSLVQPLERELIAEEKESGADGIFKLLRNEFERIDMLNEIIDDDLLDIR